MNADLISVVIPSYNHREFIGSAIESVIAQNYPAVELIVIDDGSTDGSPEWLRRNYGKRIAHLVTRENRGAHTAINEGIGLASGKYIAILNSDDVFEPARLVTLLESMQANDWDIAFSNLTFIDAQGHPCNDHKIAVGHARDLKRLSSFSIEEAIIRQDFLVTSSNLLIRREVFDRVGTFRGFRYCHDWDFLLRCLGRCSFGWVRQPLLRYRIHKRNTIRENKPWALSTENALVYVSFLLEGRNDRRLATADFVLEAEPFEPLTVAWLLAEARAVGIDRLIAELKTGELPRRVATAFEARGIPARLSTRRILKRVQRSKWSAFFRR